MSQDPLALFGLDDASPPPAADGADATVPLRVLTRVVSIVALDVGVMTALFGLALLLSLIAPQRLDRGLARLAVSPVVSFAVGLLLLAPLTVVVIGMWTHGIRPGRWLITFAEGLALGAGYAVCARALGERALPGRSPLAQTLIGLVALVLPLASPIGIPVILVAAPLGLGAWLTGKRSAT